MASHFLNRKEHIMFVILVYDVNVKRVSRVNKICKKYLNAVQKSVFDGFITEKKLEMLKGELQKSILTEVDSICIYRLDSTKYTNKLQIGLCGDTDCII